MPDRPGQARVSLALADITDLFTAPSPNPLEGRFENRSGIQRLLSLVDPTSSLPLHVDIALDRGGDPNESESRIERALQGYCGERIERIDLQRAEVKRLGFKELGFGLVFLAGCLIAGSLLLATQAGPEWLRTFLTEGLVILGWIGLWHPVDMLFFERIPLIRDQRILSRIRDAEVSVRVGVPAVTPQGTSPGTPQPGEPS